MFWSIIYPSPQSNFAVGKEFILYVLFTRPSYRHLVFPALWVFKPKRVQGNVKIWTVYFFFLCAPVQSSWQLWLFPTSPWNRLTSAWLQWDICLLLIAVNGVTSGRPWQPFRPSHLTLWDREGGGNSIARWSWQRLHLRDHTSPSVRAVMFPARFCPVHCAKNPLN